MKTAQFRVDPRLASLLGEGYRSTEQALKELIDNAWDANAENVWIDLPPPMTDKPIVVRDDGAGMTEREVRREYLNIANDRRSRRGVTTAGKNRPVKGRKGIGKFAGLVAADIMDLETRANGAVTKLHVIKRDILDAHRDLEKSDLPIETAACNGDSHGTLITLSQLNPKLSFPQPEALKELLALEYGRERDFVIFVNGVALAHQDIPGQKFSATIDLPNAGKVVVNFTIMEAPATKAQAGIVVRVGGKIVGRPSFLGLDDDREIPGRLLRRVVGEVEADSLEADVTADWGAIIENSLAYQEAREWVCGQVAQQMRQTFKSDVKAQLNRRKNLIEQRLANLPEHRREFARQQLERVLQKFYGEAEERIDTVVSLMLDAMEKDEYWQVCRSLQQCDFADVAALASALECFGLVDLAVMAQQAKRRLELLDYLDRLAANPRTLEREMHTALDTNLWVFGQQYSIMASNKTTARIIAEYCSKKFRGQRANKRPDLLLSQNVLGRYLLIEFKRPSITVGREDEAQAKEYRDDLTPDLGAMDILVVGGSVDPSMSAHYAEKSVQFLSYGAVVSKARTELNWLLKEMATEGNRLGVA